MTPRALAETELESIALPGGATVFKVLLNVADLCRDMGDASATCRALHGQLMEIFTLLSRMEERGPLDNEVVMAFTKTLEMFWRHLDAYSYMTSVERLLHHRMMTKAIASVHEDVKQLCTTVGLMMTASATVDWRRDYERAVQAQQQQLIGIMTDTSDMLEELRGVHEVQDTVVLLTHALDKIKVGTSELPAEAQAAVRSALLTIARSTGTVVEHTPLWFVPEAEVEFDKKPFARGSFATVHRGLLGPDRRVVVKRLLPGEGRLDTAIQRSFVHEVSVWYQMRHPHVIQLLGACHVTSRPFIMCEEATHGSMNAFLDAAPSHRQCAWKLLYEAAQGLAYLHSKGVVHGDVRLSNVLVTDDHRALLTDFGLRRVKMKAKARSKTVCRNGDVVLGTWRWTAPEDYSHAAQFESDVYGLGMAILEAYTGEPPYAAEVRDEREVKTRVLSGQLPRRPPGMSDRAWQLILDMTRHTPSERISIQETVDRLCQLASNEPPLPTWITDNSVESTASFDVRQALADLQQENRKSKVETATRIRALAASPETAEQFLNTPRIRSLAAELQDSFDDLVKEQLAHALGQLAQDVRGSKLLGSCGAVGVLVELLSAKCQRVRHSALLALAVIVGATTNATMFVMASGVSGLEYHLLSSTPRGRVEALHLASTMVSRSGAIATAVASSRAVLDVCLRYLTSPNTDEYDAAGRVLCELVQCDASTVRALHDVGGAAALMQLLRHPKGGPEDVISAAIETLLRVGP